VFLMGKIFPNFNYLIALFLINYGMICSSGSIFLNVHGGRGSMDQLLQP